ncbi:MULTISPECIES: hypothetical protein [unclassified Endozoicomonas]|uniref:hypothetical protein n=1 Tax=unclassified Endozoicomonas TaxID=2644528 RepID=UPI003BB5ADE7
MIATGGATNSHIPGNYSLPGSSHSTRGQQSSEARSCSWTQHKVDKLHLKTRGPDSALMEAAKHNDTKLINRILDRHPTSLRLCLKQQNQNPAIQAAVHGNTEAFQLLINYGASPNTVLASKSYEKPPLPLLFPQRGRHSSYSPANFTSETMKVLLRSKEIDLNSINDIQDSYVSMWMTPTELVNSQAGAKNRGKISALLASDPRTQVNTKIEFFYHGGFKSSFHIEFPRESSFYKTSKGVTEGKIPVSLIGQAILLNNPDLALTLLDRPDLNPGEPEGTAENLLTIFIDKLSNGLFYNLGNPLREKMVASEEFCRQILDSDSLLAKERFLLLLSMDFQSRDIHDNDKLDRLNSDELNAHIRYELSQYGNRESVEREVKHLSTQL